MRQKSWFRLVPHSLQQGGRGKNFCFYSKHDFFKIDNLLRDDLTNFKTGQRLIFKAQVMPQYAFLAHFFRDNVPFK
jgi:hypothetical protein